MVSTSARSASRRVGPRRVAACSPSVTLPRQKARRGAKPNPNPNQPPGRGTRENTSPLQVFEPVTTTPCSRLTLGAGGEALGPGHSGLAAGCACPALPVTTPPQSHVRRQPANPPTPSQGPARLTPLSPCRVGCFKLFLPRFHPVPGGGAGQGERGPGQGHGGTETPLGRYLFPLPSFFTRSPGQAGGAAACRAYTRTYPV